MGLPSVDERRDDKESFALPVPIEVQYAILDHLSQPTLLVLSAVSRAWHSTATSHSHYYLYVPLYRCSQQASQRWSKPAPSTDVACAVLKRAAQTGARVAIEANFIKEDTKASVPDARLLDDMVQSIRAVLQSTVALHITCSYDWHTTGDRLDEALCAAAPLLRKMTVQFKGDLPKGTHRTLEPDIFTGQAPCLRTVELHSMALPSESVCAFQNVTTVLQRGAYVGSVSLSTHFPSARAVELVLEEALPQKIEYLDDLLHLHRLRINYMPRRVQENKVDWDLPEVRDLHLLGVLPKSLDPYLSTIIRPSTLTIFCTSTPTFSHRLELASTYYGYNITVENSERRVRLDFTSFKNIGSQLAMVLPFISVLKLGGNSSFSFFHSAAGSSTIHLPALDVLLIGIYSETPSWPQNTIIDCPRLREVVIHSEAMFSHLTEKQQDTTFGHVAALANSLELGYHSSGKSRRCTLRIQGILWSSPLETDRLRVKFKHIFVNS